MFKMNEEEYETLEKEFEIIIKQMEMISKIDGLEKKEPMTLPFDIYLESLRDGSEVHNLDIELLLKHASQTEGRDIQVPNVVE